MKYGLFLTICVTPADDCDRGFAGCMAFSRVVKC